MSLTSSIVRSSDCAPDDASDFFVLSLNLFAHKSLKSLYTCMKCSQISLRFVICLSCFHIRLSGCVLCTNLDLICTDNISVQCDLSVMHSRLIQQAMRRTQQQVHLAPGIPCGQSSTLCVRKLTHPVASSDQQYTMQHIASVGINIS